MILGYFEAMKFAICFAALAIMATGEEAPQMFSSVAYFTDKLNSIQGALEDTINAGKDIKSMENSLQAIVDSSSFFFRTESSIEYAVDAEVYTNSWSSSSGNND